MLLRPDDGLGGFETMLPNKVGQIGALECRRARKNRFLVGGMRSDIRVLSLTAALGMIGPPFIVRIQSVRSSQRAVKGAGGCLFRASGPPKSLEDGGELGEHFVRDLVRHGFELLAAARGEVENTRLVATDDAGCFCARTR